MSETADEPEEVIRSAIDSWRQDSNDQTMPDAIVQALLDNPETLVALIERVPSAYRLTAREVREVGRSRWLYAVATSSPWRVFAFGPDHTRTGETDG